LTFSFGWYVIPKDPSAVVGAFGPSIFISNFAIGHTAWGVTSQFPAFVFHRSNAFLRVISLMFFATELCAVLYAGSWVTCHSVRNLWAI
jgi:hypothetical protein